MEVELNLSFFSLTRHKTHQIHLIGKKAAPGGCSEAHWNSAPCGSFRSLPFKAQLRSKHRRRGLQEPNQKLTRGPPMHNASLARAPFRGDAPKPFSPCAFVNVLATFPFLPRRTLRNPFFRRDGALHAVLIFRWHSRALPSILSSLAPRLGLWGQPRSLEWCASNQTNRGVLETNTQILFEFTQKKCPQKKKKWHF